MGEDNLVVLLDALVAGRNLLHLNPPSVPRRRSREVDDLQAGSGGKEKEDGRQDFDELRRKGKQTRLTVRPLGP